jgi:hypothetical protein
MRQLAAAAERAFEQRCVAHLRRHLESACARFDDASLVDLVRRGLARGRGHGLTTERDLSKYLHLCVTFGPDFEESTEHGWMADFLTAPDVPNPTERINRLERAVIRGLERDERLARRRTARCRRLQPAPPWRHARMQQRAGSRFSSLVKMAADPRRVVRRRASGQE